MSRLTADDPRSALAAQGSDELPLRFVTAASLFDGHDAAINVMRRLIQDSGAEVVHLGHNRSVRDVVRAAIQEDADGIAISSYQGGHTEYFKYAVEMLRDAGAEHIRVFGGGGGTITPEEIADLEGAGVERIYHPNDGMNLGLVGMIDDLVERARSQQRASAAPAEGRTDDLGVARMLSALEDGVIVPPPPPNTRMWDASASASISTAYLKYSVCPP
jgi:methylmalonyl-CoA mutase